MVRFLGLQWLTVHFLAFNGVGLGLKRCGLCLEGVTLLVKRGLGYGFLFRCFAFVRAEKLQGANELVQGRFEKIDL